MNLAPARRTHRASRRGDLLRARTLQRAGRPHGGNLGAPHRAFLDALEKEFNFKPPRKAGTIPSIRSAPCTTGRSMSSSGSAATFSPLPRHRLYRGRDTPVRADRADRDQAEPRAPDHGPAGAAPALPWTLGARSGARFPHRRGCLGVISYTRGMLEPASPAASERAGDHRRASPPRRSARARRSTGRGWRRTTAGSAITSAGSFPASRTSTRASASGSFLSPNPARERRFVTSSGKAQFSVPPISGMIWGRIGFLMMTIRSHDQFNTTVYGLHDRTAACTADAGCSSSIPRTPPWRMRPGMRVDITSHFKGQKRSERGDSRSCLAHPAALRGRVLPRGERAGAGGERGRGEQHTDLQIAACDRLEPSGQSSSSPVKVAFQP